MCKFGGHKVFFSHSEENVDVPKNGGAMSINRPVTTCTIETLDGEEVSKSIVKLHTKTDIPNRIKARKFAFVTALSKIENRNVRKSIGDDYRANMKVL